MRFHVLLNSPFKVLFNFPSRYLSAIGLVQVFSLRWSLPPTFGLHSQTTRLRGSSKTRATGAPHGPDTLSGQGHDQEDLDARRRANRLPIHHISLRPRAGGFGAGLFPLHSPLLGESLLVSFPPLTDMLKFSGYSRLIRGRSANEPVDHPPLGRGSVAMRELRAIETCAYRASNVSFAPARHLPWGDHGGIADAAQERPGKLDRARRGCAVARFIPRRRFLRH